MQTIIKQRRRRRNINRRRKPILFLSKFPEKPVHRFTDFVWQEIERTADSAIGEMYKPLQQPFRLGTLIKDEHPFLGGALQTASICLALRLAK